MTLEEDIIVTQLSCHTYDRGIILTYADMIGILYWHRTVQWMNTDIVHKGYKVTLDEDITETYPWSVKLTKDEVIIPT